MDLNKTMQKILVYKKSLGVGALFLILILYFMLSGRDRGPQQSQEFYSVTTGDVVRQIQLAGTVQPLFSEDVPAMVNARIKKVLFKDGDLVSKGQVLIQLNEEDLTTKLEGERVKYLNAKNKLREIKDWQSSSPFVNAKTGLANAKTDYEDKQKVYQQNEELYRLKAISRNDLDRSKIELDRARSTLEGANASFDEAVRKGGPDALQEARSSVFVAEIAYQDAEGALAYKEITAPYTGVVTMKQQAPGPLGGGEKTVSANRSVSPGEILLTISDRDRFTADAQVDEYDIFKIHLDQPCRISIPALPKEPFAGKIISLSSDKSGKSASFQVRCQIDNPSSLLKVGMTANILIPLEEKKGVLVVPLSSLIKKGGVNGVFLAGKEGPKFHPVQVGLSNNDLAEITQGLTAGQRILRKIPGQLSEGG